MKPPTAVARYSVVLATVLICLTVVGVADAAEAKLSFQADASGNLTFDTGAVKGTLQKDGLGEGIRTVRFIAPDVAVDINHGLLVPYRFLTPQKRYGFGSWEWPRTGKILPDGGAELHWAGASERPFSFSTAYHWKSTDTLDVKIDFTPEADLENFELFLGSYFRAFSRARVYVKDVGDGNPGFVEASKNLGSMQLFPKDQSVLALVNDGRWKFPPYPNNWAIRSEMAAPFGLRQDPKTGASVLFMAPPEDCFAISMSQQESPQGAFYLSMFGKSMNRFQTYTARVRLVFGLNITFAGAMERYHEYMQDIGNIADQKTPCTKITSIASQIPEPDANGWIQLFDGKQLTGCACSSSDIQQGKIGLRSDGTLRLESTVLNLNLNASNVVMRARLKVLSGEHCSFSIGESDNQNFVAWFNGNTGFGLAKIAQRRWKRLVAMQTKKPYNDFFDFEFRAENQKLTLKANGQTLCETNDATFVKGPLAFEALRGITLLKTIEVQPLDKAK